MDLRLVRKPALNWSYPRTCLPGAFQPPGKTSCGCGEKQWQVIQRASTTRNFMSQVSSYFLYEFDSRWGSTATMWAIEGNVLPLFQFLFYSERHTGSWQQHSRSTTLPQFKCHTWMWWKHSSHYTCHLNHHCSYLIISYQKTNISRISFKCSQLVN